MVHAQSSSASAVDRPSATIIEQTVALAIHNARFDSPNGKREPWPFTDPGDIEYSTRLARAALSALMAAQAVHGEQNDQARMNPKIDLSE